MPVKELYATPQRIVKVGYPIVKNFTDKQGDLYTGYAYDYLREISIYTGWEYEFIEMDLGPAMDALINGEIDLLAGMFKNEQTMQLFDFPSYSIGSTYTTLNVLTSDFNNDYSKYFLLDDSKVGYYSTSGTSLNKFESFCKTNGIKDTELIAYPFSEDRSALVQKLKDGEVDYLIGSDLTNTEEEKVIAKFGATPHYLATTKGNAVLIQELDLALSRIKMRNPDFEQKLYDKYYGHNYCLILSEEQVNYLQNLPPIRAVYIKDYVPVQYYDDTTQEVKGIFIDVVRLLGERLGISFEFIPVETYNDGFEMLKDGSADILIGVADDYLLADEYNFLLTPHYLKFELAKVVHATNKPNDGPEIVALPKGHGNFKITGDYEIHIYDTLQDCLKAVDEGRAHCVYANSYSLSNELAYESYNNIYTIHNYDTLSIALGISKAMDPFLIDIFHKAVYYLPQDHLPKIIADNTTQIKHPFNLKLFFYQNMALSLCIIGIILSLIAISVALYIRILFNKTQIDALTGIYNREACERLTTKYLKSKKPSSYSAFAIIDIDHFKQINDRFGHKIGDHLLIRFSSLLRKTFPKKTVLSRLGGDEFIVFIKDIDGCSLHKVNEQLDDLCHAMHREIEYKGQAQEISLSVGAVITNEALPFSKLYTAADELLYEVKRKGRNGFKTKLFGDSH